MGRDGFLFQDHLKKSHGLEPIHDLLRVPQDGKEIKKKGRESPSSFCEITQMNIGVGASHVLLYIWRLDGGWALRHKLIDISRQENIIYVCLKYMWVC